MTDPITDMFNRIRNAQAVLKETVDIPFSNLKYEIARILEKQGFIEKVEKKGKLNLKEMEIKLKYNDKKPAISDITRVSKSGQRIYHKSKDLRAVRQGYGFSIISTSKGLMTGRDAKKEKLGGEIICKIW